MRAFRSLPVVALALSQIALLAIIGSAPAHAEAPPPAVVARPHSGGILMPYVGFNSFQGTTGTNDGPGLRLGALAGGHVHEMVSLNGEVTVDFVNPKNVPSGVDVTALELDLAFSPLAHVVAVPRLELVIGPKVGAWFGSQNTSAPAFSASTTAYGWLLGLNGGAFFTASRSVSVGALLSFVARSATKSCTTISGAQTCPSDTGPANKVLGFSGAVLF